MTAEKQFAYTCFHDSLVEVLSLSFTSDITKITISLQQDYIIIIKLTDISLDRQVSSASVI
jgi:hypothetical protein